HIRQGPPLDWGAPPLSSSESSIRKDCSVASKKAKPGGQVRTALKSHRGSSGKREPATEALRRTGTGAHSPERAGSRSQPWLQYERARTPRPEGTAESRGLDRGEFPSLSHRRDRDSSPSRAAATGK